MDQDNTDNRESQAAVAPLQDSAAGFTSGKRRAGYYDPRFDPDDPRYIDHHRTSTAAEVDPVCERPKLTKEEVLARLEAVVDDVSRSQRIDASLNRHKIRDRAIRYIQAIARPQEFEGELAALDAVARDRAEVTKWWRYVVDLEMREKRAAELTEPPAGHPPGCVCTECWAVFNRRLAESERRAEEARKHFAERDAGREPPPPRDAISVREGARLVNVNARRVLYWIERRYLRVWGSEKNYRVSLAELRACARER